MATPLRLPINPREVARPRHNAMAQTLEYLALAVEPDRDLTDDVRLLQDDFTAFLHEALPLVGNRNTEIRWGFHLDAMAEHLQAVSDHEIKNLIMVLPPRCLKSSTLVCWSAWEWTTHPEIRRLSTSYDLNLAMRDNGYVRDLIKHPWFQERWGKRVVLRRDSDAKMLFENMSGGRRMVSSIGSRGTGEGGERVEVDDAHNALKAENEGDRKRAVDWWMGTISSRVNDARSAKIVTGQRVHAKDLIGAIIEMMVEADGEPYERLILPMEFDPRLVVPVGDLLVTGGGGRGDDPTPTPAPALGATVTEPSTFRAYPTTEPDEDADEEEEEILDPEGFEGARVARLEPEERPTALIPSVTSIGFRDPRRIAGELLCPDQWPESEIRVRKIQLGPYRYSSQYQGSPTPSEGGQFKERYWVRYDYTHLWHRGLRPKIIAVDSAYGEEDGDPTGCAVWGDLGGHLYCLWAGEFRLETPDLRRALRDLHNKWKCPFLIEDKANGKALSQDLRRGSDDGTIPALPVIAFSPDGLSKEARAYTTIPYIAGGLVHVPSDAPWTADFLDQHSQFPKGLHDDLVDTTAMAVIWLKLHTSEVRDLFGVPIPASFGANMRVATRTGDRNGYWTHGGSRRS